MTFKEKVYYHCLHLLNNKINELRKNLADLRESASNETKSTAGDKHETALAMLQIEQENANKQLENLLLQQLLLQKINPTVNPKQVSNGSLVTTNKGYLFLSIALGKIIVDQTAVIALSAESPLGAKVIGLKIGESITVNGNTYIIEGFE